MQNLLLTYLPCQKIQLPRAERKHIVIQEWLKEDAVAKDLVSRHLLPAIDRFIPEE